MSTDSNSLVTYYKPSEIISIFRSLLSTQNLNAKIVSLNGVYIKSQSTQLYNNCAYDTLRVIAIVRGGGSGIEKLDEIEVVEALTNLNTAWIYGVGHEKENLFIRNIADKVIPIPFALGTYFRDTVNSVIEKKSKSKAVLVEEIKKQFIKQIEDANKQNKALQERLTAITKSSEASQKQSKEQLEAMKKQQEESQKQAKQQTETIQKQNNDLQEKLKGMQKSLDEFTKTNSQMIRENTNLNNTIRKLSADLTAAQNHSKELERQLKENNKGCLGGCLGMFIAIIGMVCSITVAIINIVI